MSLHNKTVIVTGASSGIGAAAARLFAREGANVVVGARREDRLKELVEQIRDEQGTAVLFSGDAQKETFAKGLVDLAVTEFGGLDAAFNNAGIMGATSSIPDMDIDTWNTVMATNLTSAFFAAKYQIPAMKARGGGSIVFTSSFVGHANGGLSGMGAYAASKAGLNGLVQSLSAEHGPDRIRVNALLPGGTLTEMAGDDPGAHEYIASLHSLQRMASADEMANAALFLISDQSSFVSGSALLADGGLSSRLA